LNQGGGFMNTIGKRIRDIRTHKGLSQAQLGDLVETHRTTINSIERNGENISAKRLKDISVALNCNMNYLITGEKDKEIAVNHIIGDAVYDQSVDNLIVVPKELHDIYDGMFKQLYSYNKSYFMKEIPVILERAFKIHCSYMDAADTLLPTSADHETMIKWIDSYNEFNNNHLKSTIHECFKETL